MNITKKQYIALITEISPTELISDMGDVKTEKIMPCLLGDVLEKMMAINVMKMDEVVRLWQYLGLSKSLQTIVEEKGWETNTALMCNPPINVYTLKSPEVNELLSTLYKTFIR